MESPPRLSAANRNGYWSSKVATIAWAGASGWAGNTNCSETIAAEASGKKVRVVSMPCTSVFDAQDADYKEAVLPASVTARVAVEAAVTGGWWKYVGSNGRVVGIDTFGESADQAPEWIYQGF